MQPSPLVHQPSEEEKQAYDRFLAEAEHREALIPVTEDGRKVGWSPQPGSQVLFLSCPVFEVLYEGTRGPGKTDSLLMSFAMHCGKGYGADWRGILFRQTYPQLADVVAKSKKWFKIMFPGAVFNQSGMFWEWPGGERLYFRHMRKHDDYWNYHGHEYPWIGFEELTNWPDDQCFKSMFSCCRTTNPRVPRMIRATTNPYGVGHNWVKLRYRLPDYRGKPILDAKDNDGRPEPARVAIHGHIRENVILLKSNPDYIQIISAAARNDAEREAWLNGGWDIVAGGMFDDVWYRARKFIVIPQLQYIPQTWRIDRAFDWGSSAPFSVGWYAESDGSDMHLNDGRIMSTVRGDIVRFKEWYGWTGRPNQGQRLLAHEISMGIITREMRWGIYDRTYGGPADASIFDSENGPSIADDMLRPVRIGQKTYRGIGWLAADKSPGSRKLGWEKLRSALNNTVRDKGPRERPGLFVTIECEQFLRTIPSLPRDEKDLDDVDTEAEDHIADECRYRVRNETRQVRQGRTVGLTS